MITTRLSSSNRHTTIRDQMSRISRQTQNPVCTTSAVRKHLNMSKAAGPALVLERSLGARAGVDAQLWASLPFCAEVIPDLPVASSWWGLYQSAIKKFSRLQPESATSATSSPADDHASSSRLGPQHPLYVQTIAAQVRSQAAIEQRMVESVVNESNRQAADAFLCVSGSHPVRRLPGSSRFLQNSFSVLQTAADMKRQGRLPETLALWAVENPLKNPARRLQDKVAAGASVVITQPPLIWDTFESWYNDIYRSGITQDVSIVVGLPFVTSISSLRFWISLCEAWSVEGTSQLLEQFQKSEAQGQPHMQSFLHNWNSQLVEKVRNLPGLSGMHVMPLSKPARRMAADLLL